MVDWDAGLLDAKNAAESAAATPLFRTLLEACRSQAGCPGIVTEEAMAYLLDVAILIGNTELARCCVKQATNFPLRRWRFQELVKINADAHPCVRTEIQEEDVLVAALAAGLKLEHLTAYCDDPWEPLCLRFSVSILEAIVFSGDADLWPRVQSPQLQRGPRPAQEDGGDVVRFLLERSGGQVRLSLERMHRAEGARLALGTFQMRVPVLCQGCGIFRCFPELSLLDLAILFGQIDCSRLCGPMDIEATEWTLRASLEERPLAWEDKPCEYCGSTSWRIADIRTRFASLPERQAAAAALRRALQASLRQAASSAGFGIFQLMRSWARGKPVPRTLVKLVLTFAAEQPALLQALEGREGELPSLGHWWEESEHQDPESPQPLEEDVAAHVQEASVDVPEIHSAGAAATSSYEAREHPDNTMKKEDGPDQISTNDLLTALRSSKSDNPPLSGDGVVIFRLRRWGPLPSWRTSKSRALRCDRALEVRGTGFRV